IGALAIYMLELNALPFAWDYLVEAGQQESPRARLAYRMCYTMMVSLQWFFILTVYGTFIPNTWRRCAAVVAVLAASPLVLFIIQGLWLRPLDPIEPGNVFPSAARPASRPPGQSRLPPQFADQLRLQFQVHQVVEADPLTRIASVQTEEQPAGKRPNRSGPAADSMGISGFKILE